MRSIASSTSPMRPCQAAPAFDTTISTPPKVSTTCVEGRAHRGGVGHVAVHRRARAADRPWPSPAPRRVDVEQRDLGAGRREGPRGRRADGAAGAGDDGDLAGQRQLLAACRAWPAPATSIRSRTCRLRRSSVKRPIASASVMPSTAASAMSAAIAASFVRAAEPEQAEPRHQHDARHRDRASSCAADARVVAREIGACSRRRMLATAARASLLEIVELAGFAAPARSAASSWCGWCGRA